jgi:hypothetical protein
MGFARRKRRRRQRREAVFSHYGHSCACCGSTEALTIDHISPVNDARSERLDGHRLYFWLIREGLPPGYQTLCRTCNASKARGKACRVHAVVVGPATTSDPRQLSGGRRIIGSGMKPARSDSGLTAQWRLENRTEIGQARIRHTDSGEPCSRLL